ncbi:MAG: tetratricopeptide repeat protein [Candidatus Fermentibacteraceae bacterium]|nr:tetratricopeptide repeat protein [Candidatus Fermentibacteraceae bacterium]MBN2608422.1 tetratricopeptide repeat protein [Candidatus Fermentibacteraceae bacterium]
MKDQNRADFVPPFIAAQYQKGLREGDFQGSVLISDISGFTRLTESLFTLQKKGAEQLSDILNGIFDFMIRSVHRRGGFVANFAGDAFTAVFPGDDGGAALMAAMEIRTSVPGRVSSGSNRHAVGIRSGLDAGRVCWNIFGSGPCAFLFSGETVMNAAAAESEASTGEILTGIGAALSEADISYDVPGTDSGTTSPFGIPSVENCTGTEEVFVHPDYIAKVGSPEFRDVASVFTGFGEMDDMNELVDTVMRTSREYGGYFNLLDCGDKGNLILTLFGAPLTSARSVTRSIGFAMELRDRFGLKVRSGITYGRVFAGFIGSPGFRGHYTVIGDKVNTAARLMESCPPGEVRISLEMGRALKEDIQLETLWDIPLRGSMNAVSCYRVRGRRAGTSEFLFENRFVGRNRELRMVLELAERTLQGGRTAALLVSGEAGIGKTRFIHQARSLIPDTRLVYLKCDEILSKSLNPIETFFEEVLGTSGLEDRTGSETAFERNFRAITEVGSLSGGSLSYHTDELKRLKYVIKGFLGIDECEDYSQLDARSRFDNTILAFMHLLRLLTGDKRLFMVIDDFQWVDADTLSVLGDLLAQLDIDGPFVCILTRPCPGNAPSRLVPDGTETCNIDLTALREPEQLDLIESALPCPPSKELRGAIEEKAEGNPFYIEQMIMYLLDNHMLECSGEAAELTSPDVRLPGSIVEVIISRVDALEEDIRQTVKHASVLGRRFNIRVLSGMLKGAKVAKHLETGTDARIWNRLSELQYIFRHALIRDSVYDMQMESQLARLHLMAGDIIEELYSDDARMYSDLSHHFEKSGQLQRMLKYTLKAADYAYGNYRNREAIEMYRKYIEYVPQDSRDMEVLLKLGEVHELLGEWEVAISIFDEVLAHALQAGLLDTHAYALNRKGFIYHRMGDNDRALDCFKMAEIHYEDRGDTLSLAKVYNNTGTVYIDRNMIEEAKAIFSRALGYFKDLPEDSGYLEAMMFTYNNLGLVYQKINDLDRAAECYRKSMRTGERLRSRRNLAALNFGNIMYLQGRVDEAEKYYKKAIENAEKVGNRHVVRVLLNNLAAISTARGEYGRALEIFEEALALAGSMNDRKGIRLLSQNIGEIKFYLGDYSGSVAFLEEAVRTAAALGDTRALGSARGKLGLTTFLRGEAEAAVTPLREAIGSSTQAGDLGSALEFMYYLARAYDRLGMPDEVRRVLDMMLAVPDDQVLLENVWYRPVIRMIAEKNTCSDEKVLALAEKIIDSFPDTEGEAIARLIIFDITGRPEERRGALGVYQRLYDRSPMVYYRDMIGSLG